MMMNDFQVLYKSNKVLTKTAYTLLVWAVLVKNIRCRMIVHILRIRLVCCTFIFATIFNTRCFFWLRAVGRMSPISML